MRREVCLGLLALSVVAAPGCDTDQPLSIEEQNAELTIVAPSARVYQFNTWIVTEDSDGVPGADDVNGDGADGDESLWCEIVVDPLSGLPLAGSPASVPWTYSLQIRLIPAGETTARRITSENALADTYNRAIYDTSVATHFSSNPSQIFVNRPRGACSLKPNVTCNPNSNSGFCGRNNAGVCNPVYRCSLELDTPCDPGVPNFCENLALGTCVVPAFRRTFKFDSSRRRILTAANRELLRADGNFIFDACSGDPDCVTSVQTSLGGSPLVPPLGRCPGSDLGNPAIDPSTVDLNPDPTIFGITLEKGDTLIVDAVLADDIPGGNQVIQFLGPPGLRVRAFVDGATLQPDEVIGEIGSVGSGPGAGVSFSYTSQ